MTDHERLVELLQGSLADARFRMYKCLTGCESPEVPHCICASHIKGLETMLTRLRSTGPDGLRLMPIEPTEEILLSASFVDLPSYAGQADHHIAYDVISKRDCVEIYRAMLRAARGKRADG